VSALSWERMSTASIDVRSQRHAGGSQRRILGEAPAGSGQFNPKRCAGPRASSGCLAYWL